MTEHYEDEERESGYCVCGNEWPCPEWYMNIDNEPDGPDPIVVR
jgi:hypothetical protein